ncbi:hypothetical protein HK405_013646, partial [Cladochytrium tenue]
MGGDLLDRGPDSVEMLRLFQRLQSQAPPGRMFPLLGNHEVMNLSGDLRYVTKEDIDSFGGSRERRKAFEADGWAGSWLRSLNISARVADTVFVHGGVHPMWLKGSGDAFEEMIADASEALLSDRWNAA